MPLHDDSSTRPLSIAARTLYVFGTLTVLLSTCLLSSVSLLLGRITSGNAGNKLAWLIYILGLFFAIGFGVTWITCAVETRRGKRGAITVAMTLACTVAAVEALLLVILFYAMSCTGSPNLIGPFLFISIVLAITSYLILVLKQAYGALQFFHGEEQRGFAVIMQDAEVIAPPSPVMIKRGEDSSGTSERSTLSDHPWSSVPITMPSHDERPSADGGPSSQRE